MTYQIKDATNVATFNTGAEREVKDGKGRFDLLPVTALQLYESSALSVVAYYLIDPHKSNYCKALDEYIKFLNMYMTKSEMLRDLAKHFELGGKNRGDRNWEKGIPLSSFINSAMRHMMQMEQFKLKFKKMDEPHHISVLWNLVCLVETTGRIMAHELPKDLLDMPGA